MGSPGKTQLCYSYNTWIFFKSYASDPNNDKLKSQPDCPTAIIKLQYETDHHVKTHHNAKPVYLKGNRITTWIESLNI